MFRGVSIPLELKWPSQIRRVTMAEDTVVPPMADSIPLELKWPSQIRRVTMAEDTVVPPMAEIIGQAKVKTLVKSGICQ